MNADEHGADRAALEAFVIDNDDLALLEDQLDVFNVFEAAGLTSQEIRHSAFIAFLLDPGAPHGLGDTFLKRFLMIALRDAENPPLSAIDIDLMDLSGAEVRREWKYIDILVTHSAHKLTVVVENKTGAQEHGNQLEWYRKTAAEHFPEHRIVHVFLTPEGRDASDDAYLAVSYGQVQQLLEWLVDKRGGSLGPDVRMAISHYIQLIRRHIVAESDIADLCQKIWKGHKRALDLLLEHRPDLQADLAEHLVRLRDRAIAEMDMVKTSTSKYYLSFTPQKWEDLVGRLVAEGWELERSPVFFEIDNLESGLFIRVYIAPIAGPLQETAFRVARSHPDVFMGGHPTLRKRFTIIFEQQLLEERELVDVEVQELLPKVEEGWQMFLEKHLPPILNAFEGVAWPSPEGGQLG